MAMFQPDINAEVAKTLRDIVGGGSATQYISEQDDMRRIMNPINRDTSLADLDRLNQANDQSRAINPLEVQIKGAEARKANSMDDAYQRGMRSGELGTAMSQAAKGKVDTATVDSSILKGNAENKTAATKAAGQEMLQVAAFMSSIPPSEYATALSQIGASNPQVANSPVFQTMVNAMKQDPTKALDMLRNMAQKLAGADPALENARVIHAGNNDATRYTADQHLKGSQASASAHIEAAKIAAAAKEASQKIDSDIQLLLWKKANKGLTPSEEQQLKLLLTHTYNLKQLEAPKPDIPGISQTNPAGQAVDRVTGSGGTGGGKVWDAATGTWKTQ